MAKNKTSFKPGVSGNPAGGPKLPEDLRILIKTTGEQMKRDICDVYSMKLVELQSSEGSPDLSAGKAAIISCLNNSIQSGDFRALSVMLDRILGKIPDAKLDNEDENKVDLSKDQLINDLVTMLKDK